VNKSDAREISSWNDEFRIILAAVAASSQKKLKKRLNSVGKIKAHLRAYRSSF
jgi:hypothetical protein